MDQPMTTADWHKLPWLLQQKRVMEITGYSRGEVSEISVSPKPGKALPPPQAGKLRRHKAGGGGRYLRVDVQRLCGITE